MKKILFLILIGLGVWNYYGKQPSVNSGESASPEKIVIRDTNASTPAPRSFSCDGRMHCSDMTSRAEAEYFSRYCPGTKMDGDHDGVPCENDSRF
ncbi:excalibur calcium-binding domain-containing protein [Thiobacillus denitrificans]|uniref:excalibur calcium-binding domain-containing protein n=1 Tax=Thiobacillus denitrificans TaxID=36861 RepID=UPI0009D9982D|nr:excalibur calcium-binding domain-containing protein [Thiobacillus denitrificans]